MTRRSKLITCFHSTLDPNNLQCQQRIPQSAAACCPNGCREWQLWQYPIDDLLIMEQEAIAEVQAANAALAEDQNKVAVTRIELRLTSPPPSDVGSLT
jgi:hypothetical protein